MLSGFLNGNNKKLTKTEKSVVEYVNLNVGKLVNMSIVDVANETFTSPATVSRTIKKCGLNGFAELRYKLSSRLGSENKSKRVNEILEKSIIEVTKTIENISIEEVLRIVRVIKESKKIYILARGLSELVAEEFNLKMQLLGYNTFLIKDPNIMINICRTVSRDETVVIFSIKGTTEELVESAKNAKRNGAKIVSCCCVKECELNNNTDYMLIGYKQNRTAIKNFEVTSRLPLVIISRAIIDYLII